MKILNLVKHQDLIFFYENANEKRSFGGYIKFAFSVILSEWQILSVYPNKDDSFNILEKCK